MGRSAIHRVVGHVVCVQCAVVQLHIAVHLQLDEIRVPAAAVQRPYLPQGEVLEANVRRAALHGDIAVQAAVRVAVDSQLSRPGNALNLRTGRLIHLAGFAGQVDIHVRAQEAVVHGLHRVPQRAEVGIACAGIGGVDVQIGRPAVS